MISKDLETSQPFYKEHGEKGTYEYAQKIIKEDVSQSYLGIIDKIYQLPLDDFHHSITRL